MPQGMIGSEDLALAKHGILIITSGDLVKFHFEVFLMISLGKILQVVENLDKKLFRQKCLNMAQQKHIQGDFGLLI